MTDTTSPDGLKPCPLCGAATVLHENDWCEPSEWCVICTDDTECGIVLSSDIDRSKAVAKANRRSQPAEPKEREALIDAVSHLAGAASAYRKHASRHKSQGRPVPDPMFSTRASDFDKAVERGRRALSSPEERKG